jgi:hypothetical protein
MINEIRDYFSNQIRKVNKDLRFDGYVFNNEKISQNNIDNTYKLIIGETIPTRLDVVNEAIVNVTILIFKVSGTNRVNDFDKIYCQALALKSKITNQTQISQHDYIKSIVSNSISPEAINDDDNSVRMRLEFKVTVFYTLED